MTAARGIRAPSPLRDGIDVLLEATPTGFDMDKVKRLPMPDLRRRVRATRLTNGVARRPQAARARGWHRAMTAMAVPVTLAVAGCGGGAASATMVSPERSPPATSQMPRPASTDAARFTSARYGYTVAIPTGWKVTETPGTGGVHPDEPGVDTFKARAGHILSVVGEPNTPALAGWTCAINRHLGGEHDLDAVKVEMLSVGGEPARLSEFNLIIKPYLIHYLTVEVTRGGRGLTLSLESTIDDAARDREVLDAFLASFAFTA